MAKDANDFPAVALDPKRPYDRIRELYLYEEPELLNSIRRGDRREATRIINLILVHIYSAGEERSELLKGLLLELVVMMSRAAVEAGAPQSEVLGLGFRHLAELAGTDDDESLAAWLRQSVLRIFEAVEARVGGDHPGVVGKALQALRGSDGLSLTRDEIAQRVGISPGRLGQLLKERTGRTFHELQREARVAKACRLLAETDWTLATIAAECAFCDQSYLTHVFQEDKKVTPGRYREQLRGGMRPARKSQ